MASVTIYVEGGGDGARGLQQVRLAFGEFFSEFAGCRPKIVACGGRGAAYSDFISAINRANDAFVLLLVDAEGPVEGISCKQHLAESDQWDLTRIDEDQLHLMVQAVEAWMIADRGAVRDYFGDGFNENALPKRRNPEEIPKDDLKGALDRAGRTTRKNGYHEIADGTKIIARLDPARVRAACPHCRALFAVISRETGIALPDLQ